MELSVVDMYVIIVIVGILVVILRRDATKYAETQNITRIDSGESKTRREYIASGITDSSFPGSKILIIMYSLFCRKCNSTNIFAEIGEDKEHVQVFCRDCGYTTLIPLKKLLISEEVLPSGSSEIDEKIVREYLSKLNKNHEVAILDPDEEKSHKQE